MINYIWSAFLVISITCGIITNKTRQLSNSIMTGASDAISLVISIAGMMALWTGLMKIAEKSGLTSILAKVVSRAIT